MMTPEGPEGTRLDMDNDENTKDVDNKSGLNRRKQKASNEANDPHLQPGVRFNKMDEIIQHDDGSTGYQSIDLTGGSGSGDKLQTWDIWVPEARRKEKHVDESKTAMVILKMAKVFTFILTFLLVLGDAIFSKIILVLMTSQILPNRTIHLDEKGFGENQHYRVNTPSRERMGWYWAIFFALIVPEMIVFLQSLRIILFKSHKKPSCSAFFGVLLMETIHTIGLSLLVFEVFPKLDVIRATMLTNCLCTVPALVTFLSRSPEQKMYRIKVAADVCCILVQIVGLAVWSYQNEYDWTIAVAAICVSCGWWENFVDNKSHLGIMKTLIKIRKEMKENNSRHFSYFIISSWKILLHFCVMLAILAIHKENIGDLVTNFKNIFENYPVDVSQVWKQSGSSLSSVKPDQLFSDGMLPVYLSTIQIATALVTYLIAKFACKICIQEFSFALPATMTVPIAIFMLSSGCLARGQNLSFLTGHFPKYVYWTCPSEDSVLSFLWDSRGFLWILMFFSQMWVTSHIWISSLIPLISTDKLFVLPKYTGVLIDQSLVFNRRRHQFSDKGKIKKKTSNRADNFDALYDNYEGVRRPLLKVNRRKIYACATMWHETKEEMVQILKSIMRMDTHLTEKRYMDNSQGANYDFETHIFFDDAFYFDKKKKNMVCNNYVKDLIITMNKAASYIYPRSLRSLAPPIKFVTPYGGRLVWKLPGITEIIVHLKDKDMIRHKKRWSQVMYMYYLLGYKLEKCKSDEEREDFEENVFVLALDGDIDFKPQAVTRLVELMEDESLGAACGRIHPIGSGLIVWYQKFEYAVGHWLQKATEHVIGCVLCSPGCFSLFRGKTLMQVMRTYASKAEEALEYVQYDQGEDRWLCTLILKKGYRIQYSAASDAYTHCPETFGEFYTQRRRWGPSTMANIMDILMDYKHTVKTNNNISMLYIVYQLMIMIGTILGPGTIFLMVVGSMVAALPINNVTALLSNLVPITFFILSCFFTKNDIQIIIAQILSAMYALLMMAVLVGTIIELQTDGVSSPSGIFLVAIASSFIIAAIIHPYEFFCLVHGFLYFMCVPSMYLLLTIYSLINLNVVSWGTREDPLKAAEEAAQKAADKHAAVKKESSGPLETFTNFFQLKKVARLCNCSLCTYEKETGEEKETLLNITTTLGELNEEVTGLRKNLEERSVVSKKTPVKPLTPVDKNPSFKQEEKKTQRSQKEVKGLRTSTGHHYPYWVKDEGMKKGPISHLPEEETNFFVEMIKKYLLPLDSSPATEARVAAELIDLRNNVVFGFIMFNSMFILIVFLLQMNKETLFINWPFGGEFNITFIPTQNKVLVEEDPQRLDPIGLVFAIFFGIIIAVQFVGMLLHRFETFSQIISSTTIDCRFDMIEEFEVTAEILKDDDEDDDKPNETVFEHYPSDEEIKPSRTIDRKKSIFVQSLNYQKSEKSQGLDDIIKKTLKNKLAEDKKGNLDRRQSKYLRKMSIVLHMEGIIPQKLPEETPAQTAVEELPANTTDDSERNETRPPEVRVLVGYDNEAFDKEKDAAYA